MAGYAVAPAAAHHLSTLLYTTVGTWFCIASANSINQFLETPYDAQMSRTQNRVLVRHAASPIHGFSFGIVSGIIGTTILYTLVNPITGILGCANIVLYTMAYTPMKRTSIANTWVGAVVGAIPPMMGWTAVTGSLMHPAPWLLGAVLFSWQFPHFNALSWNLRSDYAKAGYVMTSVVNPMLNARAALRYSLLMFPISFIAPWIGLTSYWFALNSLILNSWMSLAAFRFWRNSNEKTARALFFSTLIHLPVFMALLMIHKINNDEKEET
ncbi:Protoheme IX farnesyltransferase, mitochondrial, partial [Nowakowskiella sp. JEL0078]